ncbi:GMC oxidoreductase [Stagnihabitans tardus]|uniref:NAD(P)-binding protein n=1 Tax=Stagnihabitans tardus TaxID=2699202 RepID=A0AAE5BX02_9RHOB|nr:GMC family oxidoreductase [Stagnihabitans tardus]NBZ89374.1 NAD(P)-binding protein [Stagnihabitans tardus]
MRPDLVIIGSGMGGATLAAALAPSGRRILVLERGDHLTDTPETRDDRAIFGRGHFRPRQVWLDGKGQPFNPGNYYYVGGNSKFYGAVLIRYRREDFSPLRHMGGTTPGWPLSYDELEPDYQAAERLYNVRGQIGEDPTEPPHSGPYPFPPVPDETSIAWARARLKAVGLHPSSLPLGVDLDAWLKRAPTPWDAFPNAGSGKMDAETALIQALRHPNVTLLTQTRATRLRADATGRILAVEVLQNGQPQTIEAESFALAAGAVQTAALLLGSSDARHPRGLANGSDQVGRNFMNHNASAVLAVHPLRRNAAIYQKTFQINDFYLKGPEGAPLGNIQLLGKISGPILQAQGVPGLIAHWIAKHSWDFYAMSEDLPDPESRVTLRDGQICLDWRRSNWEAHLALVRTLKAKLRQAGFPLVLSRPFDRKTPSHQCGTARMGADPRTSVVDPFSRAHDHPNLWITDASVLPTSAAVNPALTIAALSLRAARRMA